MPRAHVNGIELEYEVIGRGEPLLLIMGLGAQMIVWPDALCERLSERGFQVIRFDNRDVGRSSKLEHLPVPALKPNIRRWLLGQPVSAPYTLSDMASDAAGLLTHLGIERTHVAGSSMGGMIAQTLAAEHPGRVMSLTSIMSSPGRRRDFMAHPRALRAVLSAFPAEREEAIEHHVHVLRQIGSRTHPTDRALLRDLAERCFDRSRYPAGFARQMLAIFASGNRGRSLERVEVPTVVVHGKEDRLVPKWGGRATARLVPDAHLVLIEGMAHDMPRAIWPRLIQAIASAAERGRQQAA